MNLVYASAVGHFLAGHINANTATFRAQLLGDYTLDPAHTSYGDLDHLVGSPHDVTVNSVTDGGIWLDPVTFVGITTGQAVYGVAVYVVDAGLSNPLMSYSDRRADLVPINLTTDGADLTFTWVDAAIAL